MKPQNFQLKNEKIQAAFLKLKKTAPNKLKKRLNLSWSNWGFGREDLSVSAARLEKAGIRFIELHGNHYGPDLGYRADRVLQILGDHGIKVAGVCGMFSAENDLSSAIARHRQAAIDYLKREVPFTAAVGGSYILVVPGAVGRPQAYDNMEFERSVETLQLAAGLFVEYEIRAAVEPIRSAEVSLVHSIAETQAYIKAVNHPGVQHINGDVYHMQVEESHIGAALVSAGSQLTNLHVADSNRLALGEGALDLDTMIMALYVIGYNREGCYVTPEPLGPGGDPYPAMFGRQDPAVLDRLVLQTARYFRAREQAVLSQ